MHSSNDFMRVARTWIGTPFHHQGRLKGIGCDCLGLVIGIAQELNLEDQNGKPLIHFDEITYSRYPNGGYLIQKLQSLLMEVSLDQMDGMQAGDLVLFDIKGNPQHLGLVTEWKNGLGLLHAHAPSRRVIEHHFDDFWIQKLRKVFRWPPLL